MLHFLNKNYYLCTISIDFGFMRKRTALAALLLFLATQLCHAHVHTLAEADGIIVILVAIVIALLILGGFGLHYNKIISQRNEQLRRILNALDDYRAIVGAGNGRWTSRKRW